MRRVQQVLAMAIALAFVMLAVGMAKEMVNTDPVKAAPDIAKQVLDNRSVRVFDFDFKPGAKIPTFALGDHTVYFVTDGDLKITDANGKTQDIDGHAGEVMWMPAGVHQVENTSPTEVKCVITELKGKSHMAMTSGTATMKKSKSASNMSKSGM